MGNIKNWFINLAFLFIALSSFSQVTSEIYNRRSDTIDILNYKINIDFSEMGQSKISASCEITFESKMNNIDWITLDLLQMNIDSVQAAGIDLGYIYNDSLLNITLPNSLNIGDQQSVTVFYQGEPQMDPSGFGGFYFQGDYAYNMGVAFESQPHNYGRVWHPCFDNFVERATYDIEIIAPPSMHGYSNGYIHSESVGVNNENIRRWKLDESIPTYLACVAVAPYTHVDQTYISSISNAETPVMLIAKEQDTTALKQSFINLFGAMDAFEHQYGLYQWNKIGFALVPFNGGAMEHATCVMYPTFAVDGSLNYETLMAHELSHHWWGNLVTCKTAEDMWINEGLASYSESIFLEHVYGYDRYLDELKSVHRRVIQNAHYSDGDFLPISGVPHDATYGSHTYSKGATLMHNLRTHMGDTAFFNGLKAIQTNHAFTSIDAEGFRDELNQATHYDATHFFDNYVFNPGFNGFEIDSFNVSSNAGQFDVEVYIQQKLFEAPNFFKDVPIQVTFLDETNQSFSFEGIVSDELSVLAVTVPFEPAIVYLNKDYKLLNAVTAQNVDIIADSTTYFPLNYAYFTLMVDNEDDTSFMRIEHCRIPPDRSLNGNLSHLYEISPDRYWKVDGLLSDSFSASGRLFYDARNNNQGNLDNGLMIDHGGVAFHEDSLVLLWRKNQRESWEEYPYYELNPQGTKTDGYGRVELLDVRLGEYTFGFKKSTLSVQKNDKVVSFKVYPNPSDDSVTISCEDLVEAEFARIYDESGRVMNNVKLEGGGANFSIKSYQSGTYFVLIYKGNEVLGKQKLMKK
ncbi:hypothetical protein CW751_10390 [Brumimicrobium salinarum]|uniref:Aminopeptidase N n=1 Tax=Brumimicrobium salinarum TaxID=2058658 RepID=A0A2I0R115_9FLAO|nr:M1 family aminopeptidase [Brumimicrobium salinarum]PKR80257.1 hypothetical protein CW751_10390 [Brumimicrobium salinarum]